jgi:hypothetical protein
MEMLGVGGLKRPRTGGAVASQEKQKTMSRRRR